MFDLSTRQWTWVQGSSVNTQLPVRTGTQSDLQANSPGLYSHHHSPPLPLHIPIHHSCNMSSKSLQ
jgi:hypothetical protein